MSITVSRKIETIEAIPLRIPFTAGGRSDTGAWGGKDLKTVDSLIVKVTTDQGLVGWGESFGFTVIPAVKVAIEKIIAPLCIGRDPSLIGKLMHELQVTLHIFGRSGAIMYGLSALDIALWDIAGKEAGQPVHQLLGGSDVDRLPCYASLIRYTDPELVTANVTRALSDGYRHIKLHEVKIDCVRSAREAAGDDVEMTLDVNCPWTVREALDRTNELHPYNLRWLEEPVWPPENYDGLARVRREGGIPIAAGENASTLMDFQHLLQAQAVDFVQPSPAKMGGITELRKVFALASAHNTTVMVHAFYDGPGLLASVHSSAALGGPSALVEWRYFDLEAQLYGDAIIPKRGAIAVPQGPGLGIEPDADVIRDYRMN
ncbi:mandelate racemase/muconate lactonizing enzyme family protein [Noviherbaspirillum saxi]|uniref:Mandelate racemase/muconate lactonizing enzyme family protein n=1 Tax=Noviherbaspirillum saxi TaxID=2320863 RepID=A0A3A3G695_9BURK|nr:mandelate racemase/muconate lactonizing enzyme family protein [Noviherbaspirillum saxi]RJF95700.1 mandelate racemase/muconate lactonizing enzyme family protein [Noviherbaspirillum saxi]